ncbi:hypothetical protein LQL77_30950 [Rhodococcus cerastii]|nr:hypothetical protein [Rhodococcus cerastii]
MTAALNFKDLLQDNGLDAVAFFASGVHQNHNTLVVDNVDRNAIQWISDWLNLQIGRAARADAALTIRLLGGPCATTALPGARAATTMWFPGRASRSQVAAPMTMAPQDFR